MKQCSAITFARIYLRVGSLVTALIVCAGLVAFPSHAQDYTQLGLDIDGEAVGDQSGRSVSLSSDGSVVAIGAWLNDGAGVNAGHVRIYLWNGSTWAQRGADIDGEAAGDASGFSVSLSSDGSVVAIGASFNDGAGTDAGHARIYSWDGSAWTQRGTDIDGEAAFDEAGSISLSSDGSVVAIGASFNDDAGTDAGHVRIYSWDGSDWTQQGTDIDGEAAYDESGRSVALSSDGSVVAIGAIGNDRAGNSAGHTRIYSWDGSAWTQRGGDIDGEAAGDQSGRSVSLSSDGSVVAIGAIGNDGSGSAAGHVRIYSWDGSAWTQQGTDIDGEAAYGESGRSVALSSDGNIVAIGAIRTDGQEESAGLVRIYSWDGSAWTQKGSDIDGKGPTDASRRFISLSSDGSVVAIGAIDAVGAGSAVGHVRVLHFTQPPNTPPVADADAATTNEDVPVDIDVVDGDTDADGDALTVTTVSAPSDGTAQIINSGTGATQVRYTPDADFFGSDSFTYTVSDGTDTDQATVTVTIDPVNDAPSFTKGANESVTNEAGAQTVAGWATDISPGPSNEAGQAVTFDVTNDANALFSAQPSISPTGTLTYTPAADADGTATVTAALMDDGGTANGGEDTSAEQTFTIEITTVPNTPPVADADAATTNEDAPIDIDVLDGDTDADGDALTVTAVSTPTDGAATIINSGSGVTQVRYAPDADFFGSDSFTYTVSDGTDTDQATVTVTIDPVNDAPTFTKGSNESVTNDAGAQTVAGWATSISPGPANESGQAVTFTVTNDANALFSAQPSISPTGTLTYTPAADADGTATVTAALMDDGGTANGGEDTSAQQTFTIEITTVPNTPPVADADAATTDEDTSVDIDVLDGDTDADGDALTVTAVSAPTDGAATIINSGNGATQVRYTPDADFFGSDSFTYTVSDGTDTDEGAVTLTIDPVNDAPSFTKGANESVTNDAGAQTVAGWATAISPGPSNEAGQAVTFDVTNDANALFSAQPSISPDGDLTYTPASDADGTATVTAALMDDGGTANGGQDTSARQTFTIEITTVPNTPPVADADAATTDEDAAVDIDVLDGDTDADGDALTVTAVSTPTDGTATIINSGNGATQVRYTPDADFFGSDSFTYTVSDGTDTDQATVTVTVNEVPTHQLTVTSTNPNRGVVIKVDPVDNDSMSDGTTEFTRTYDTTTQVTLTAPMTEPGGNVFAEWQVTGQPAVSTLSTIVTLDATKMATAVYSNAPPGSITVTRPDGGEQWTLGSSESIEWTSENVSGDVRIQLHNSEVVVDVLSPSTPDDGEFLWSISGSMPKANDYVIRVSSVENPDVFGDSEPFTLDERAVSPDRDALISLYNATQGASWTQSENWLSDQPVSTWFGVATESSESGERVVSIKLAGNNLDGAVPDVLGGLSRLEVLDLVGNEISDLPDLSGAENLSTLLVADNQLTFEDLEPNTSIASFVYAPQSLVGQSESIEILEGYPFSLNVDVGGSNNRYQWTQSGIPIAGAGASNYFVAASTAAETGFYVLQTTNPDVPGLTIESRPVVVAIRALLIVVTQPEDLNPQIETDLPVNARLPAEYSPDTSQLCYRRTGDGLDAFECRSLSLNEDNLEALIPGSYITPRGVDYYFRFEDDGIETTVPKQNALLNPFQLQVAFSDFVSPVVFRSETYRMISIPLDLEDPRVASVFPSSSSSPMQRVLRWDSLLEKHVEHDDLVTEFRPGRAFWYISNEQSTFSVGRAKTVVASKAYEISLHPGWTQIGNPFAFPVRWDDVGGKNDLQPPVAYDPVGGQGGEYIYDQTILEPWEGYWVYNPLQENVTISVPRKAANSGAAKRDLQAMIPDQLSSALQLTASLHNRDMTDAANFVGFARDAAVGTDSNDIFEAPPVRQNIRLSIVQDGVRMASSYVPPGRGGGSWTLEISTDVPETRIPRDEIVSVRMIRIGEFPTSYSIHAFDARTNERLRIVDSSFHLRLSPDQPVRRVKLIVGTDEFASNATAGASTLPRSHGLDGNYPNPLHSSTRIQYRIHKAGPVRLLVFNAIGQRVATLLDEVMEPGWYDVSWDATDDVGQPVPSGVYLYRLRTPDGSDTNSMVVLK